MEKLLQQAIELKVAEYMHLKNPIFKGQTSVDEDMKYWVVFEENGKLYKFHKTL